ncbi:TlpA family protein disulfide reductase [Rhodobium gokarnense]|uniref:Thiol-disulfide isomerase/thioredoxin n=1 Tax=Rhodobium gokarnense TaxID=364296 RepID=A0ABT3HEF7_9HYPH|nr:redoxin domain-containing protein [Rhodobium gokarnense]MCW2308782.1 thiol-disulfide isomerase/thioredoxin [Rhodobium gokarnense]
MSAFPTLCRLAAAVLMVLAVAPLPSSAAEDVVALKGVLLRNGEGGARPVREVLSEKGPTIVHFWATWCVPCRRELPSVDRFAADLDKAGNGDRLLVVSVDRFPYARIAQFLSSELGLGLTTWQDAERKTGSAFRTFGYPATLIVDRAGTVTWRHIGPLDWDDGDFRKELYARIGIAD